ncbi:hypothetical protein NXS98_12950 [Fontisphaera persica]|uniref:hypothetical protein n=1 Tax=Fontisphaera persica TaxID=2974023 RepID=UPI0024BFC437|nr:hypothetical protein [Fontisphaera persica]WCJ58622.1 hypothetical protein NXS98_12950 [Fontisphaera persica]
MKTTRFLAALGVVALTVPASAQISPGTAPAWHYTLLGPSTLTVDCPVCGRPSIPEPLRGGFEMRLLSSNLQSQVWLVDKLAFYVGDPAQPSRLLTGSGQWRWQTIPGEPAKQEMFLELQVTVRGVITNLPLDFTHDYTQLPQPFPLLKVALSDTRGSNFEVYRLDLLAAPAREIWFSTRHNFTGGLGINGKRGDLLSAQGRVVRRLDDLIGRLGLMPGFYAYNVDALDLGPRGDLQFSLDEDIFSETMGPLYHGDLLSHQGQVVRNFSQWLAPFTPMPPTPNVGLDAVARLPQGGRVFSVRDGFFSQALGRFIRPGDLLTEEGQIYRTAEQLLTRFKTREPAEAGLDAVYVWPHGEIWFSTERGFQDDVLGPIQEGDLLSSVGYVVFRNLDLLNPFQPLEDLADFGLDALHVVTDCRAPPAVPPRVVNIQFNRVNGLLSFQWDGDGQVFQLEWAPTPLGPWQPVRPPEPDAITILSLPAPAPAMQFFRVRQW